MKKYLAFVIFLLWSIGFVNAQQWETDYDKAVDMAKKEDKNILLVFQGSDWCAPCIKLDREVWSSDQFQKYAEKHFVLLKADFPRKKKNALPLNQQQANAVLAENYNKNGIFPLVVILNQEGEVLGVTSYQKMTPAQYIEHLESIKA